MNTTELDTLTRRALAILRPGHRGILGIAGSPGSGKSTLADALTQNINHTIGAGTSVALPMDGFHLDNRVLTQLGRADRKGAVDTFDGWGFLSLISRLRPESEHRIYAPTFDRDGDRSIANAISIEPTTQLIIAEGNYLLLDQDPWARLKDHFDQTWFCTTPEDERISRLISRHTRAGRNPAAAEEWARNVDGTNATLVESTRHRADLLIPTTTSR